MITFHPSADGGADYLDLHTPDGDRLYLPRHEMRGLLQGLLVAVGEDVACERCGRMNGVHRISVDDAGCLQRCEGAKASEGIDLTQLDELVQDGQMSIDAARVSLGLRPLGLPETSVPSRQDAPGLAVGTGHQCWWTAEAVAEAMGQAQPIPGKSAACVDCGSRWVYVPGDQLWRTKPYPPGWVPDGTAEESGF